MAVASPQENTTAKYQPRANEADIVIISARRRKNKEADMIINILDIKKRKTPRYLIDIDERNRETTWFRQKSGQGEDLIAIFARTPTEAEALLKTAEAACFRKAAMK
jgi:hypothetical protein